MRIVCLWDTPEPAVVAQGAVRVRAMRPSVFAEGFERVEPSLPESLQLLLLLLARSLVANCEGAMCRKS